MDWPQVETFQLLGAGLLSGFLGGFLGVGGGIVFVPLLTAWFALHGSQLMAPGTSLKEGGVSTVDGVLWVIANSLFLTLVSAISGSWKQYRLGNFYLREVLLVGLPGGLSGLLTSALIARPGMYDHRSFALFFSLLMVPLLWRVFRSGGGEGTQAEVGQYAARLLWITGLASGVVSALSGLGGGVVVVPILSGILQIPLIKTTSISLGSIVVMSVFQSFWYAFAFPVTSLPEGLGMLYPPVLLPLVAGILVAAPLGVKLHQSAPRWVVKLTLLVVFSMAILQMNFRLLG
ncbi:MAG: sulfite exporter TauE/SafE family protein [Sphingomonadales bacterium]|nr:sulfite exporter TauE/SafE family protein [Sphingomonadales bacterium]